MLAWLVPVSGVRNQGGHIRMHPSSVARAAMRKHCHPFTASDHCDRASWMFIAFTNVLLVSGVLAYFIETLNLLDEIDQNNLMKMKV